MFDRSEYATARPLGSTSPSLSDRAVWRCGQEEILDVVVRADCQKPRVTCVLAPTYRGPSISRRGFEFGLLPDPHDGHQHLHDHARSSGGADRADEQMRLINALCRFAEMAEEQAGADNRDPTHCP